MCRFDTGNMDTGKEGRAALCRMSGNFLERCREQAGRLGAKDRDLPVAKALRGLAHVQPHNILSTARKLICFVYQISVITVRKSRIAIITQRITCVVSLSRYC